MPGVRVSHGIAPHGGELRILTSESWNAILRDTIARSVDDDLKRFPETVPAHIKEQVWSKAVVNLVPYRASIVMNEVFNGYRIKWFLNDPRLNASLQAENCNLDPFRIVLNSKYEAANLLRNRDAELEELCRTLARDAPEEYSYSILCYLLENVLENRQFERSILGYNYICKHATKSADAYVRQLSHFAPEFVKSFEPDVNRGTTARAA